MAEDDAVYERIIDAMRHLKVDYVEGVGATSQPLPQFKCPHCARVGTVRYRGTEVLEGSLEWCHVVHTEVDHHLACAGCSATWTVYKML